MPDPTEAIITATFVSGLGIFALTAAIRRLMGITKFPAPPPPPPVTVFLEPGEEFSPYGPPSQIELEGERANTGRIPTWFYRPLDLLGMGFVFIVFFGLVVMALKMPAKEDAGLDMTGLLGSIAFQFIIAGIVTAFVIGRIHPMEWLGLRWPQWLWSLLIAPCTVLVMWALFAGLDVVGYMDWIESLGVETTQDTVKLLQESADPKVLGLMAFAAVIAAPFCEEIVFRGYLYPAAKSFAGPWVAGICSALVFAAAHGSLAALLPLFIFGCVLVIIYEKTGSLWAPISVHFCFNGATVLIQLVSRHYNVPLDPGQ